MSHGAAKLGGARVSAWWGEGAAGRESNLRPEPAPKAAQPEPARVIDLDFVHRAGQDQVTLLLSAPTPHTESHPQAGKTTIELLGLPPVRAGKGQGA